MVNNSKNAFWQALLAALVVFLLGITIGFLFELSRNTQVADTLYLSETSLLDQQLQTQVINSASTSCEVAKENLFSLADSVYVDAALLEKYDSVSKFQNTLNILHRRYDLLRLMIWSEGVELKARCHQPFHTVVYVYSYGTNNIEIKAQESTVSKMLSDMKEIHGSDLLLLPIAGNLNLSSVNAFLKYYNVTQLPAIIIDQNKTLFPPFTSQGLEQAVFQRNTENLNN